MKIFLKTISKMYMVSTNLWSGTSWVCPCTNSRSWVEANISRWESHLKIGQHKLKILTWGRDYIITCRSLLSDWVISATELGFCSPSCNWSVSFLYYEEFFGLLFFFSWSIYVFIYLFYHISKESYSFWNIKLFQFWWFRSTIAIIILGVNINPHTWTG